MSHEPTTFAAQPPLRSLAMPEHRISTRAGSLEPPPLWTATRIDVARRLWCKGVIEADILATLNRLAGAPHTDAQALVALARRLCWPRPQQALPVLRLTTRDGLPSMAERQALEGALDIDVVELPMADAIAWGRANGVPRQVDEPDAVLLVRINRARAQWSLPQFRISRALHVPAAPPPPPPPVVKPKRRASRRRAN